MAAGSGCCSGSTASRRTPRTAGSGASVAFGDAVCGCTARVGRCAVTTQDPDTGVPDLDTLRFLADYRSASRRRGAASDRVSGAVSSGPAGFESATAWSRCDGSAAPGAAGPIDPATTLGDVVLTVADLDAQAAFYRDAIGLREIRRATDSVELGAPGDGAPLVTLIARPDARSAAASDDRAVPPRAARAVARRSRTGAQPRDRARAPVSRVPPTTSSRRRSTSTTPRATGSRSIATGPVRNGRIRPVGSRWRRSRSTSRACLRPRPRADAGNGMAPGTPDRPRAPTGRLDSRCRARSTPAHSASSRRRARTPERCSSRRAATTTMSVSTPGAARAAPAPPAGSRGLRHFTVVLPDDARTRPDAGIGLRSGAGHRRRRRRSTRCGRPVRQPGSARRGVTRDVSRDGLREAGRRDGRAGLPFVGVRVVSRAEIAQRHPERAMLHLPDVAQLVREEVVGRRRVTEKDDPMERVAVEPPEPRQAEEPWRRPDSNSVDPHRGGHQPSRSSRAFARRKAAACSRLKPSPAATASRRRVLREAGSGTGRGTAA